MPALLTPVKSKLFIVAHRRTWGLLDGEYASVFRGRSLDYDDLREYVIGDEVPASASEFLDAHLREALPEIEREYLDAALNGLGTLIDIAARTPIPIAGADQSVELGMGPQAEDDS